MTETPKTALCLPGGGLTGALYQIGALAALADGLRPGHQGFSLYLGHSSGASVAAALAGGIEVDRLYRALLDPVDNFFPLERGHLFRIDLDEWRRAATTSWVALRHAAARLSSRRDALAPETPGHLYLWEQIDRLADSLPAGLFTLDRYERFLAEFFLRRGIPNGFRALPRALRIPTYDVDSGERVVFGAEGHEDIPVSLACAASLALPPYFSPVRIGEHHFIDGGLGSVAHLDVAAEAGVELAIVVNPLVPVSVARRAVPTGHGVRQSVRDKGLFWVMNQANRIAAYDRLREHVAQTQQKTGMRVLVLEPAPSDVLLFLHNPSNLAARRAILEYAYRTTRERIAAWMDRNSDVVLRLGWQAA